MKQVKNMSVNQVVLHGEAMIIRIDSLPKGTKPLRATGEHEHIIADSETTGNHHVISLNEGVSLFENDGKSYMQVEDSASVSCVIKDRHDEIKLPSGVYEFGIQQEYDHVEQTMQRVQD